MPSVHVYNNTHLRILTKVRGLLKALQDKEAGITDIYSKGIVNGFTKQILASQCYLVVLMQRERESEREGESERERERDR